MNALVRDTEPRGTIAVKALRVERGGRRILDAELEFTAGVITAVLGPNGAGKSTLLSCVAGLLTPQSGCIEIDGTDIAKMSPRTRAQRIALLPQSPEIAWPVDVATLVGLGRIPYVGVASDAENEAAVSSAMTATDVRAWSSRVATTLSGGERARVLLARVLAGATDWILADEPFTGLDPAHQFDAADLLRCFAIKGGGVILTIHDLNLAARIADRIVILNQGRVAAQGTPRESLTPQTLRMVYGIDTEWLQGGDARAAPVIAIHGRHAL